MAERERGRDGRGRESVEWRRESVADETVAERRRMAERERRMAERERRMARETVASRWLC